MPTFELGTFIFLNVGAFALLFFGFRFPDFRIGTGLFMLAGTFFFITALYMVTEHSLVSTISATNELVYDESNNLLFNTTKPAVTQTHIDAKASGGLGWIYFGGGLFCIALPMVLHVKRLKIK